MADHTATPAVIGAAVAAGVDWVQVRERALDGRELLALTDAFRAAAQDASAEARILVNRRSDVALAAGADGVHLGFDAAPPEVARALLGDDALVGCSAHAPDELRDASGLSYAHLAPIFTPLSKPASRPPLGVGALTEAARHGVPVLAQGGLDAARAREAIAAGAAGVAVTGAILHAPDPARAARGLREALDA